jgi:2-oxo-4-hydroxy-4-carboxy-5-ureidoimidazoline decarboxylase
MTEHGLTRFNNLPALLARDELLACCASVQWAERMIARRPYRSLDVVLGESDAAVAGLAAADLAEALARHPRIGERAGPRDQAAAWSRQEQSGALAADQATARALADGNVAYESRFGHVYLICAAGRSAGELLAILRTRLGNDAAAESRVVRAELAAINRVRLRKLLGGEA